MPCDGTGSAPTRSRRPSPSPAYAELHGTPPAFEVGDPAATVGALFAVVDADEPPLRVFFGRSFESVPGGAAGWVFDLAEQRAWWQWTVLVLGTLIDLAGVAWTWRNATRPRPIDPEVHRLGPARTMHERRGLARALRRGDHGSPDEHEPLEAGAQLWAPSPADRDPGVGG